jgi:hypothetical protein
MKVYIIKANNKGLCQKQLTEMVGFNCTPQPIEKRKIPAFYGSFKKTDRHTSGKKRD